MTGQYEVAAGRNNTGALVALTWQPATPTGLKYPEYRYTAAGSVVPHGIPYYDLDWETKLVSQRVTILSEMGLTEAAPSAALTMTLQNNDGSWGHYNVIANYLQEEQRITGAWEGLRVRLVALEALV